MSVLNEPVLVLTNAWLPIEACTVEEAFKKIFAERAKILDPESLLLHDFESWAQLPLRDGDLMIRTYMSGFRVPEIIILATDGKLGRRKKKIAFSRCNLIRRDEFKCQYCGEKPPIKELTVDHVVPKCRGGRHGWTNCVAACFPCNLSKGRKTVEEARMTLSRQPFEPKWSPVFRVSAHKRKASWDKFLPQASNN